MIENLKDLEKLFKLCRKQGITEMDLSCMKFKLGDLPQDTQPDASENDSYKGFPSGELTPEQLIFYSSGGLPQDDPILKATAS